MTRTHLLIQVFFLQFLIIKGQFNATFGFINVGPGTGTIDPGPYPQVLGLYFSPFQAHGVSLQPAASGRFAYSAWPLGAVNGQDDYLNFTGDLSGLAYYETRINVLNGYELDLASLSFNVRRSGTGIRNYAIKSSLDNFNSNLSASTGTNANLQILPTNIFFWRFDSLSTVNDQKGSTVSISQRIKDSIIVRVYGWNAESSGGSFSIDNVTFSGKIIDLSNPERILEFENGKALPEIYFDIKNKILNVHAPSACQWVLSDLTGTLLKDVWSDRNINISDLKTGIYFVRCQCQDQTLYKKIVIEEN